jgi:hypothetical protein
MKNITSSIYNFEDLIQGNFLYVDKTEFIWQLIQPAKEMYFLSRPRRFGKSLTISTLKAVFEGKKDLFKGLALYDKPYDWKSYPIIHLDMNGRDFRTVEKMEERLQLKLLEQAKVNNVKLSISASDTMFHELINTLYERDGDVVLLLDEYDKPILNNIEKEDRSSFLETLKIFYSVIKEKSSLFRFIFITGVSKFCHVSLFSDLNNLTDISMDASYATMFGYTQEELEANFGDRILSLAGEEDIDTYKAKIKEWYNGYRFHEKAATVYNPVSLAEFFRRKGEFDNYWYDTGTPTFLMKLFKDTKFDFHSIIGCKSVPKIVFSAWEIDSVDPLTLMYQTGYATIKSTEQKFDRTLYFLDFPNREVEESFSAHLLNSYAGQTRTLSVDFSQNLADCLLNNDLPLFRKTLEVFFAGVPYDVHKKNEAIFQGIFFSIFKLLGECIEAESTTNDGRIDAVIKTSQAIYIFEFKLDNDPTALDQIKEKEYYKKYLLDKRDIYIVGVNFDSVKGNLIGWEDEKIEK